MAITKERTVRIGEAAHRTLRDIATETGEAMPTILDRALEEYRRKRFLERANACFLALRSDPEVWSAEQEERAAWDTTLADDLKDE